MNKYRDCEEELVLTPSIGRFRERARTRRLSGLAATVALIVALSLCPTAPRASDGGSSRLMSGIVGMYVFEMWPYGHPYSARTWTMADWHGYAGGLHKLGYNTILLWPMLENMPDPLTPSDKASLVKHAAVIDMLHNEFGMRVIIVLCPNIIANEAARQASFEERHFYWTYELLNPGDTSALQKMMAWREKIFTWLRAADGVAIIDSDPGGYPSSVSSNADFIAQLKMHRDMLDRLRPGIELDYWEHVGWRAWNEFQATGAFQFGSEADHIDTLSQVRRLNPEPWGLANGLPRNVPYIEKVGLGARVISYNYGAIEDEPTFPMTNFGGNAAHDAGAHAGPRGVMGNAQTAAVQLPNIFAFARGAAGMPVAESDYVAFAERLVQHRGKMIVASWEALEGTGTAAMRQSAHELRSAARERLEPGDLQGLLFGSAPRFLNDLAFELDVRAAYLKFLKTTARGGETTSTFSPFVRAAIAWQAQHGYQGMWNWPGLQSALRQLHSPDIDEVLSTYNLVCVRMPEQELSDDERRCGPDDQATSAQPGSEYLFRSEDFTTRLLAAMRQTMAARKE
jgi:hypothetical protein